MRATAVGVEGFDFFHRCGKSAGFGNFVLQQDAEALRAFAGLRPLHHRVVAAKFAAQFFRRTLEKRFALTQVLLRCFFDFARCLAAAVFDGACDVRLQRIAIFG